MNDENIHHLSFSNDEKIRFRFQARDFDARRRTKKEHSRRLRD